LTNLSSEMQRYTSDLEHTTAQRYKDITGAI
jgi:hypothetical protein